MRAEGCLGVAAGARFVPQGAPQAAAPIHVVKDLHSESRVGVIALSG